MSMTISEFVKQNSGAAWVDRGREMGNWDCWGLVYQFFKLCYGIDLPMMGEHSCKTPLSSARLLLGEAQIRGKEIQKGREKLGDVIFFRPCHSGIVIRPGQFFHCKEETGTILERYDNAFWLRQLMGIYRHEQLVSA
jgi:cell wall-associated NlpC family hydrolase